MIGIIWRWRQNRQSSAVAETRDMFSERGEDW
jgi:hypothetical protein